MQWGNTSLFRQATGWFRLTMLVIHFQLYEGKKNPQIPFNSTFFNSEGYSAQISPTDTTQMKERSSLYYLRGAVNQMGTSMGVGIKEEEEGGRVHLLTRFPYKNIKNNRRFQCGPAEALNHLLLKHERLLLWTRCSQPNLLQSRAHACSPGRWDVINKGRDEYELKQASLNHINPQQVKGFNFRNNFGLNASEMGSLLHWGSSWSNLSSIVSLELSGPHSNTEAWQFSGRDQKYRDKGNCKTLKGSWTMTRRPSVGWIIYDYQTHCWHGWRALPGPCSCCGIHIQGPATMG